MDRLELEGMSILELRDLAERSGLVTRKKSGIIDSLLGIATAAPAVAPDVAPAVVGGTTALPPVANGVQPYLLGLEARRDEVLAAEALLVKDREVIYFSRFGKEVVRLLKICYAIRKPVCLLGGTGLGKTVVVAHVARQLGLPFTLSTNLTPATRIESLIGMPTLRASGGGTEMVWSPGIVDLAARFGGACVLEEVTRSNETMSQLFSLTDQMGRILPEPGNPYQTRVPVHPDFWLVTTGNPVKAGTYSTTEMDQALKDRFFFINCEQPIADEPKVLRGMGTDPGLAKLLVSWFGDIRRGGTIVSTRCLLGMAKLVTAGMTVAQAAEGEVIAKYPKLGEGMRTLLAPYLAATEASAAVADDEAAIMAELEAEVAAADAA